MRYLIFTYPDGSTQKFTVDSTAILRGIRKGLDRPSKVTFSFSKDTDLTESELKVVNQAIYAIHPSTGVVEYKEDI